MFKGKRLSEEITGLALRETRTRCKNSLSHLGKFSCYKKKKTTMRQNRFMTTERQIYLRMDPFFFFGFQPKMFFITTFHVHEPAC